MGMSYEHILGFLQLTIQVRVNLVFLAVLLHIIFISGKEYNQLICSDNKINLKLKTQQLLALDGTDQQFALNK